MSLSNSCKNPMREKSMDYKQIQTITSILMRDACVFKKHIISRFIDACIWSGATIYVSQYILPQFGISPAFGKFIMIGNIAAWGMFEVGTNVSILMSDIQGVNSLGYYLSLPVPTSWIFIRIGLIDAYKSFVSTLPLIPVGKLVLWNFISLSDISYGPLLLSYVLAHLFFGFLGLFLASIMPNLEYLTTIKLRIIFPMWFLGCYQFSWHMLYNANPTLAYINLLNPITYIMEGMRSTIIHDQPLISYPICTLMTIFFIFAFAYAGVYNFKKRLDCV